MKAVPNPNISKQLGLACTSPNIDRSVITTTSFILFKLSRQNGQREHHNYDSRKAETALVPFPQYPAIYLVLCCKIRKETVQSPFGALADYILVGIKGRAVFVD